MTVPTYESFAVKKQNTNQTCLTVPYLVGDLQLPFKNKKGYLYALLLSIMSRNLRSKNEVLFVEDGRSQRMREREREREDVCVLKVLNVRTVFLCLIFTTARLRDKNEVVAPPVSNNQQVVTHSQLQIVSNFIYLGTFVCPYTLNTSIYLHPYTYIYLPTSIHLHLSTYIYILIYKYLHPITYIYLPTYIFLRPSTLHPFTCIYLDPYTNHFPLLSLKLHS